MARACKRFRWIENKVALGFLSNVSEAKIIRPMPGLIEF